MSKKSSLHFMFNEPFKSKEGTAIFAVNAIILTTSMINISISTMPDQMNRTIEKETVILIDLVANIYFNFEWLLRLFVAPVLGIHLSSTIVILELLSNLVLFCDIGYLLTKSDNYITGIVPLLCTVRCLRLCRLYWHSFQLQLAWRAVRKSVDGLLMMLLLCIISIVFLANLMFYTETLSCEMKNGLRFYVSGPKNGQLCSFQTIFDAFWWSVTTISTVGIGVSPATVQGKILASFVMLMAVIMFTFPITIISAHLTEVYMSAKKIRKVKKFEKHHVVEMSEHSKSLTLLSQCESDIQRINKQMLQLTYTLSETTKHLEKLSK